MNFICPYCNHHTTITDPNLYTSWEYLNLLDSKLGKVGFRIFAITCPNKECGQLYLKASLTDACKDQSTNWNWKAKTIIQNWNLLPESEAKVLPDYIPDAIKQDYYEACRIRDLSPKVSATLARRCLQGMIRDFWTISKTRLKDEVEALKEKVDPLVWQGIDAVRSVGNIGAHMEKDINLIIDVEPDEAQLLIGLIENLINDWYVARNNKQDQLEKLKQLAEQKGSQKESD